MNAPKMKLTRESWTRWRRTVRAFATSEVGGRAAALFALLFAFLIGINGLNVLNSYVGRDFMTEIEHRSSSGFVQKGVLYVGVFALSTLAAVLYRFTEERLGLLWRQWLTQRIVRRYVSDATYFRLREASELANPDQRIADDVRTFTAMTLSLTLVLLNATFTVIAFAGVMWSISPRLFVVAAVYAAIGSVLTVLFGRPLVWLNYNQADREASLRAELVHVRENAESIALGGREGQLRARIANRVDHVVVNAKRIIAVNRNLGFFTTGYNYLIQIIPVLIVAPLFIQGQAEFGVISQSAMAFSHLVAAFSVFISQFQAISSYAVVLARLGVLTEAVEQADIRGAESRIAIEPAADDLGYRDLTLCSARDGRTLVERLTLDVPHGLRVLVAGPNESARVALFRATAGLFDVGAGSIRRPESDRILFLTERPYVPPGSLRHAVVPPGREREIDDARILDTLAALGAAKVATRAGELDTERDWDDLLSLGEQQLVALTRVVLAAPRFVLLDRPTTTLSDEALERALEVLAANGVTPVTFAADPSLVAHHDACLSLENDGTWTWRAR